MRGGNGENGMGAELLTAEDVAAMLQVRKSWVYAATRSNAIPHVRLGRYVRFRAGAIEAWLGGLERDARPLLAGGRIVGDSVEVKRR